MTKTPEWTILKLLRWTTDYFKSRGVESPRAAAEILLAHTLDVSRIDLYLRYDQPLISTELARFRSLIKRRANREPVAYIVGAKEFWSMTLSVTDAVLIPRPETETLVERALVLAQEASPHRPVPPAGPFRILEIGTGSGAIILALAAESPGSLLFASDISPSAVQQARSNAMRHGLEGDVCFFVGDLLEALRENRQPFQILLSNPPYIQRRVLHQLEPEISRYEPRLALDGHEDGLFYIRQLIRKAHHYLSTGGHLLLEIGHDQKPAVERIADDTGVYDSVVFTKDYGGFDRVVSMRKRG